MGDHQCKPLFAMLCEQWIEKPLTLQPTSGWVFPWVYGKEFRERTGSCPSTDMGNGW